MKHAILFSVFLSAALLSGLMAVREQLELRREWHRLSPAQREDFVLGPSAATVRKVKAHVAPNEAILLIAGVDPALLPYVLFPRKIWQRQVDPETNSNYMDLSAIPSPYPLRPAESFPVDWRLEIFAGNIEQGGQLQPHQMNR